jgi:hypothetical protein
MYYNKNYFDYCLENIRDSFSRLSIPSKIKGMSDSGRTYQHFYGEKNPKLF